MKATYFAATAIAAVALSGTAHAAFTSTDGVFVEDLGIPGPEAGLIPTSSDTLTTNVVGGPPPPNVRDPYLGTGSAGIGVYHVLGGGVADPTFPSEGVFSFGSLFPEFELHWGSPDTGGGNDNLIKFYSGGATGTLVGSVTGGELLSSGSSVTTSVIRDDSGAITTGSISDLEGVGFAYVKFTPDDPFDTVVLTSIGAPAFEFSSAAAVPLPAAAWLFIGGLGAVGAAVRHGRKKRVEASA